MSLTLLQKRKEVRFWFPATIPAPYEPPGSALSGDIKFKKFCLGPLTNKFSKQCLQGRGIQLKVPVSQCKL